MVESVFQKSDTRDRTTYALVNKKHGEIPPADKRPFPCSTIIVGRFYLSVVVDTRKNDTFWETALRYHLTFSYYCWNEKHINSLTEKREREREKEK